MFIQVYKYIGLSNSVTFSAPGAVEFIILQECVILWYWYIVPFLRVKFVLAYFSSTLYLLLEVHKQPCPYSIHRVLTYTCAALCIPCWRRWLYIYLIVDENGKFREDSFQKWLPLLLLVAVTRRGDMGGKKASRQVNPMRKSDMFKMVKLII